MATYTITTAVNIDTLAAKAGSDTYNINGGYLTVDQHTRYGTNQNTSAGMGNITLSATLGGTIEFNSTKVRLIPYNTGTGNVPALGTTISRSGASGILLGVYSALNVAPTAAAAAMPASGYILVRQWNSVSYTAGALTGIAASATAADGPGWLEIVGVDALTATVNRLNQFLVRGDWFDFLGVTTDGNRATTYQLPTNGALVYCPGVWVETATAGVYEFYPNAGSMTALAANIAADAVRGRWCWISTAGLVQFGNDGTNSTGGYCPPSGRKIRVPNIFFNCCTSAAKTVNVLPNATLATRYEFATTGGGVVDIDGASCNWYMNFAQPYQITLKNCATLDAMIMTECAAPIVWDNVGIGQSAANSQIAITLGLNFAGGTVDKLTLSRANQAATGNYVGSLADCSGFTFNGLRTHSLVKAAHATTGSLTLTRVSASTFNETTLGGGRAVPVTCTDVNFNNSIYYDRPALNTLAAIPMYAFDLSSNCLRVKIDGITFGGLNLVQPYNGLVNFGAAGCTGSELRNVGTYASPLSLGSPRVDDAPWTRATTTATVTKIGHGFAVNDTIFVPVSSDIAAITAVAKTITSVPTADTFTFACLNAGAASGTICYFGTKCANVFVLAAGAAANDIKIQRVYAPHTRTNLFTADNSSKNVLLANVFSDYLNVPVFAYLNGYTRNVSGTPTFAAQVAVYGTHWFNGYVCDVADNQTGVSWARSGSTITVTAAGHSLRTGLPISVVASSDTAAATLGYRTVTVTSSSTFTFTGAAAGATSGTLDFRVGNGRIAIMMNEPTADTTSLVSFDSGSPAFTSAGGLYMPVIGDQVTFTTPEYIIGQGSSFPNMEVVMAGGTLTNYDIAYAIDKNDGSGYSAFKNLSLRKTGAGGTNGATNITMTSTTGVAVDDYVWGTNVGPNAKVVSITNATTIVVDRPNIGTVSGTLRFTQHPSESGLGPDTGIKMKWRITTAATNATAITSLALWADSTTTGRAYQYPLDLNSITFTDLVAGTDVVVLAAGTETILDQVDQVVGTSYTYNYSGAQDVDVGFLKPGYVPLYIRDLNLGLTDSSIPIAMVADRNYS